VSADETTTRLQGLLERAQDLRRRLDEADTAESAVDLVQELTELAKETQAELDRAQRAVQAPKGDAPS
jgi:hypothetical protein